MWHNNDLSSDHHSLWDFLNLLKKELILNGIKFRDTYYISLLLSDPEFVIGYLTIVKSLISIMYIFKKHSKYLDHHHNSMQNINFYILF